MTNLDPYAAFVAKVKSNTYYTENVKPTSLLQVLLAAKSAAEFCDTVKRSLYYGKQTKPEHVTRMNQLEFRQSDLHDYYCLDHLPAADKDITHMILGVIGEGGELATALLGMMDGRALDKSNVKEEIGDILWYLQGLATACGFSLSDCFNTNVAKLMKRYPDAQFSSDRAENRDLDGERKVIEGT